MNDTDHPDYKAMGFTWSQERMENLMAPHEDCRCARCEQWKQDEYGDSESMNQTYREL